MENADRNPHMPVYNIKAVSRLVGLLPVTLRAWERRYGLPIPHRGIRDTGCISDYDLRTLHWIKAQVDAGLNISRAVEYLNELRSAGRTRPQTPLVAVRHPIQSVNFSPGRTISSGARAL